MVNRVDTERQDAVSDRLLDVPDPLAQGGETGRARHGRTIGLLQMRKAHPITCNCRFFAGSRMSRAPADPPGARLRRRERLAVCDMLGKHPPTLRVLILFSYL